MSSTPSPPTSRLSRMGGALRRTSTLLSTKDTKATSTTTSVKDTNSSPSAAPAAVSPPKPKRGASQASLVDETAAIPAKSRLARMGGTLRRNSSLLAGKVPATPSIGSSERDARSPPSKGPAAPVAIAQHKRGASQVSLVDASAVGDAPAPSKSPLARIGGALRRSSSRGSIKGAVAPSGPSSERDSDSTSVTAVGRASIASRKRSGSQASLVDESAAGETAVSKSRLGRIGGALRRSSSRLSITRPRTPSITSSDRDADSKSIQVATAVAPDRSPPSVPTLDERPKAETAISQELTTTADPSTLRQLSVDASVSSDTYPPGGNQLSPVQENPLSPLIESTLGGSGGFTDEPEEIPQPVVRDLSLSQMEWIDEPEPITSSAEQPIVPPVIAEAVAAPPSSEHVIAEPLAETFAAEPATTVVVLEDMRDEALALAADDSQERALAVPETQEVKEETQAPRCDTGARAYISVTGCCNIVHHAFWFSTCGSSNTYAEPSTEQCDMDRRQCPRRGHQHLTQAHLAIAQALLNAHQPYLSFHRTSVHYNAHFTTSMTLYTTHSRFSRSSCTVSMLLSIDGHVSCPRPRIMSRLPQGLE
ncbi:hypothetical protein FPV67DRAFT_740847 [Lyophyllum atratum]|nr:hypothetical protein FPV67DRAFT_740847 [Lyophyllum atratum]